ncbi:hypothetical protein ACFY1U_05820 [Streptomyces sp. NPDC001351]|uniref:hypothetical protein n=1 Tax=Streptomyces sp. NPDC001351 TaxID=3364564 RepID=UPI0036AA81F4
MALIGSELGFLEGWAGSSGLALLVPEGAAVVFRFLLGSRFRFREGVVDRLDAKLPGTSGTELRPRTSQ